MHAPANLMSNPTIYKLTWNTAYNLHKQSLLYKTLFEHFQRKIRENGLLPVAQCLVFRALVCQPSGPGSNRGGLVPSQLLQ